MIYKEKRKCNELMSNNNAKKKEPNTLYKYKKKEIAVQKSLKWKVKMSKQ